VDTEIEISRDQGTGISIAQVTKQREYPTIGKLCFTIRQVELGVDADGDAVTACVIDEEAERAGPPLPKDKPLTQTQQRALRLLGRAIEEAGSVPLASKHTPSGVLCVAENVWRQYCYQGAISVGDQDAKRMAFKRAAEALVSSGHVGRWGSFVWPS
jgi:hypothetical protein